MPSSTISKQEPECQDITLKRNGMSTCCDQNTLSAYRSEKQRTLPSILCTDTLQISWTTARAIALPTISSWKMHMANGATGPTHREDVHDSSDAEGRCAAMYACAYTRICLPLLLVAF